MRRRDFLTGLASAAAAWSFVAAAQRSGVPVIGFLGSDSAKQRALLLEAFRRGLAERGFVEGKDVVIEYRWAEGRVERLPALAQELVQRRVALIVASGGNVSAVAAKAATSTIPIVFTLGGDPVKLGLVATLSRPGGNVTGVTSFGVSLDPKRLELLRELLPAATNIAFLANPWNPATAVKEVEAAASAARTQIQVFNASSEQDLDKAFAAIKRRRTDALLVANDALFLSLRHRIVALAARHAIPAIYGFAEFASAGGLMSYGADRLDQYRQVGVHAGRVLKGAAPAELPVLQVAKFDLIINVKTAKALGIAVPPVLASRADRLID